MAKDDLIKCYVCDQSLFSAEVNIFETCTENTKTPIHELLEQFIGHNLSRTAERCFSCIGCLNRINDYDLACYTAHQVQKELTDLLKSTDERYSKNDALLCVNGEDVDEENDYDENKEDMLSSSFADIVEEEYVENEVIEETAYALKEEPANTLAEQLDNETDEYELRFFAYPDIKVNRDIYETEENTDRFVCKVYTNSISELGNEANTQIPTVAHGAPNYCLQCERNFATKELLREHRRTIHKKPPKLHECTICGIKYKIRNALRVHLLLHSGDSPFQCDVCGKKFTQKGALKRHMPIHTGECRYQCEKCGKQFIHYSSFHMHNLAHDDVRKKKCDVCGLLLRSNSHLKRHLQVHTGAKPHKCPKCDKTFAQRYNMMTHLRSHQGLPRKRKHTCPVCERVFTKETSLQDHLNTGVCRADDSNIIHLYNIAETDPTGVDEDMQ